MDRFHKRLSASSSLSNQNFNVQVTLITKPKPAVNRRRSSWSYGGVSSLSSTMDDDDEQSANAQFQARNSYRRYSDATLRDEGSILPNLATPDANDHDVWENIDLTLPESHPLQQDEQFEKPKSPNYLMHYELASNDIDRVDNENVGLHRNMTLNRVRGSASTVMDVASIMIGMDNEVIRLDNQKRDDDADTLLDVPLSFSRDQGRRRQSAFEQNLDEIISRLSAKTLQMGEQQDTSRLQIPTTASAPSGQPTSKSKDHSPKSATTLDAVFSRFSWTNWTRAFDKHPDSIPAFAASTVNLKSNDSSRKSSSLKSRNSQECESVTKPPKVHVINIGKREKGNVKENEKDDKNGVMDNYWDLDAVVGKLQNPLLGRLDNQRVAMKAKRDKASGDIEVKEILPIPPILSSSNTLQLGNSNNKHHDYNFSASLFETSAVTVENEILSENLARQIPPRSASLNRLYLAEALYGHPAPVTSRSVVPVTPPPRAVLEPERMLEHQVIWELDEDGLSFRRKVFTTRPQKLST